jgi:RNA polymerase sigma-70 factor (ECF subfamily)
MVQMEPTARGVAAGSSPLEALSFEAFFQREHATLKRSLYVLTGDDAEAEDITQEAFCRLWERWSRVRLMERPDGYLYRTAMNLFRSRYRRLRTRVQFGREAQLDELTVVENRVSVMRALQELAPRQRAAIVLTEYLEMTSDEAGEVLGVRPSTVRNLAAQGRRVLMRFLEEDHG